MTDNFATPTLTERQRRERDYYAQYSAVLGAAPVNLATVDGSEPPRPWNPYWHFFARVAGLRATYPQRLLDFGCGAGDLAVTAAWLGYEVDAFDISPENVALGERRAMQAGVGGRIHWHVSTAEQLPFNADTFDVVAGIDILHHVDIPAAMRECARVMRQTGVMLFKEPVEAPIFDRLRNTRLVRKIWPNSASFDLHITEDERKLSRMDRAAIGARFSSVQYTHFRVLSRLERLFGHRISWERVDVTAMRLVPPLARLAGSVVLEASGPRA